MLFINQLIRALNKANLTYLYELSGFGHLTRIDADTWHLHEGQNVRHKIKTLKAVGTFKGKAKFHPRTGHEGP